MVGSAFVCLSWLERRRPLRKEGEPKARRAARNLTIASTAVAAMALVGNPVVDRLSREVARRRTGLVGALRLPMWAEVPATILLLDYTLYFWHALTHRVPFLWRFHLVHHADLDLDASTALRFHFGELTLSVLFRCAQIALIGAAPLPLSVWQTLLLVSILFHHSNVRLPAGGEARLSRLVMTPRLHGIHHAAARSDTDSNFSSGFTIWDRLHGTLRTHRSEPATGLPGYRDPRGITVGRLLLLPFRLSKPASQAGWST
jgi:sterol desaturase/sphingolipid hydroxylase (fatty acid hydroxylase superfamily)